MRTPYVAALTAVSLAAATLAAAPLTAAAVAAPPASRAPASALDWGSCHDAWLTYSGAKCAKVAVPLDYRHPGGRTIRIAISRIRHTSSAADYKGAILVNPGGPGASGLSMATIGSSVPHGVGDDYDWIGFDPRGVGASRPALRCVPNYFHLNRPDYRPRTHAIVSAWKHRARRYADRCAEDQPKLIKHLTTPEVARDLNSIRRALGVERISFYGYSYGTYLGQVFATMFPSHLKRLVLDSTVDPKRVWYDANIDQDLAFDRVINIWFSWVAKYHDTYRLGATRKAVRQHWYDALHQLARHPAGGTLGPAEWSDAFLLAGYTRSTWLSLGRLFSRYVHGGHWRGVASFYRAYNDTHDDNGYAVYLGVQCTDAPWPQHWSRWEQDSARVAADAPFLTWGNTWFNAPCLYWHAPARNRPIQVDGSHVGKVLMIDERLDAATPFEGSLTVRRLFPHAALVAEPGGTTHADSLSGDDCVDNLIAKYLGSGALPARRAGDRADVTCQPLPDPVPAHASRRSRSAPSPAAPAFVAR
jgi:pimeloyl-ACP methyl ester carboxylesterase